MSVQIQHLTPRGLCCTQIDDDHNVVTELLAPLAPQSTTQPSDPLRDGLALELASGAVGVTWGEVAAGLG